MIQLEIKLTGILSTYALAPGESAAPYGTEVYPGVNAHHHQHLFCLRLDPSIDGNENTVFEVDAVASDAPVGSRENRYGNAFTTRKNKLQTMESGISDYNPQRTWDISNTNKLNAYSKNPVSYKLVSREVPGLMPKEGSLVWDRAGFARHALHVTKYADEEKWPAGRHVPQNSGRPSQGKIWPPLLPPPPPPSLTPTLTTPRRPPLLDRRQPLIEHRQHGHRGVAHLRRHSLPVPGRLPHHACGAYVGAAAAEELLHAEPVLGRAAVVFE